MIARPSAEALQRRWVNAKLTVNKAEDTLTPSTTDTKKFIKILWLPARLIKFIWAGVLGLVHHLLCGTGDRQQYTGLRNVDLPLTSKMP